MGLVKFYRGPKSLFEIEHPEQCNNPDILLFDTLSKKLYQGSESGLIEYTNVEIIDSTVNNFIDGKLYYNTDTATLYICISNNLTQIASSVIINTAPAKITGMKYFDKQVYAVSIPFNITQEETVIPHNLTFSRILSIGGNMTNADKTVLIPSPGTNFGNTDAVYVSIDQENITIKTQLSGFSGNIIVTYSEA